MEIENGFYSAPSLDEERGIIRPYKNTNDKAYAVSDAEAKKTPNSYFSMRDLDGNPISFCPSENPSDSLRFTQDGANADYRKERDDFPVRTTDDKKPEKSGKKMSGRKYIVFTAAAFLLCVSILCIVIVTNSQCLEDIYDRIVKEDSSDKDTGGTPVSAEPTEEFEDPSKLPDNSNDDAKNIFNETYWAMSFGQSLGYNYAAKFSADGTFVARGFGSGAYENGTYTYSNGELVIVFDIDGFGYPSTIEYSGDENGFTSLDEYPMQVGKGHYHISPDDRSAEYFNDGLMDKPQNDNLALPDGEYYGQLDTWDSESMTIELLEYAGIHEQSYNYILNPTGQVFTLDISQAEVWLEYAWDHSDIAYASIDAALDTEIWDGETTVQEQCSMQIYFVIENAMVQRIVILYAA